MTDPNRTDWPMDLTGTRFGELPEGFRWATARCPDCEGAGIYKGGAIDGAHLCALWWWRDRGRMA
jgi:hypothetical protein